MTDEHSGRPVTDFHHVLSELQAKLLTDEGASRFFYPFLARELTISEAAAEVGCKASVMLYRAGVLLKAGLLNVVREIPRAGRAIKVYRSVHDAYFVPYAFLPHATLEDAFLEIFRSNADRMAKAVAKRAQQHWDRWDGWQLFRDETGSVWFQGAPDATRFSTDPGDPDNPGIDFALEVYLHPDEAKTLQSELASYLREYRGRSAGPDYPGQRKYLLVMALGEEG